MLSYPRAGSKSMRQLGVLLLVAALIGIQYYHSFATTTTTTTTTPGPHSIPPSVPLGVLPRTTDDLFVLPAPRNRTAVVCVCSKREAPYIDEWVDYHLGIGFQHVYLYDNTPDYELEHWGHERRYQQEHPIDVMSWIPVHDNHYYYHGDETSPQRSAYRDCAARVRALGHEWVWFGDIDEFLVMRENHHVHVNEFLEQYLSPPQNNGGGIGLHWRIFGTSKRQSYEPIPVTKRFQRRVKDDYSMNKMIKTIHRVADLDLTAQIKTPHHLPMLTGENITLRRDLDHVALVYHFMFKSRNEYIHKRMRGAGFSGKPLFVDQAKAGKTSQGKPIPAGHIFDDAAWQILCRVAPRYRVFDDNDNLVLLARPNGTNDSVVVSS